MADSSTRSGDTGSPVVHPDSVEAFENVIDTERTVLVDFFAEWCGPCKAMAPTVAELADESDATVAKVNVEEVPQLSAEYNVKSIPAFVVFESGEPTDRLVGMQDKSDLRAAVE